MAAPFNDSADEKSKNKSLYDLSPIKKKKSSDQNFVERKKTNNNAKDKRKNMKKRPSLNLDEKKEEIAILEDDNGEGDERDMD